MVDNFDIQQNLKRQLATQKHQTQFSDTAELDTAAATPQPAWLQNLYSTVQRKQAEVLTKKFSSLLQQLPLVAKTNSPEAINLYLENVVAELTKIYYVRLRVLELNDQMPLTEKNQKKQSLVEECQTRLATILAWINSLTSQYVQ